MPATELLGRKTLAREVGAALAAGRSVLLYGPEGIGKSAIVAAVRRPGVEVLDPFEHVSPQNAARIRRAMDAGRVYLAAARSGDRQRLGAVGRVLWRFSPFRVRELPDRALRRIVVEIVSAAPAGECDRAWVADLVRLASGRPGFAVAMARFAVAWETERGFLPIPAFAFATVREDAAIRQLRSATGRRGRHHEPNVDTPSEGQR